MKCRFFLIFVLSCKMCISQDLVANGTFEDADVNAVRGTNDSPAAWYFIKKGQSRGYMEVTNNTFPTSGNKMMCFIIGSRQSKERTYWQTMLLHALEKGKKYRVVLNIHGWDDPPSLHDIGVYLTDEMIFAVHDTLLQPSDYVSFLDARVKELKKGWFRLEKEFVARGDERFLILGNFSPKDYQEVAKHRYTRSFYVCDFVDDIQVSPVEKITCDRCLATRDSLYAVSRDVAVKTAAPEPAPQVIASARPIEKKVDTLVFGDILFAFGSYQLLDPNSLNGYGSMLEHKEIRKLTVIGYTDDIGSESFNLELAKKRAMEIARQIASKFNISESIIEVEGRGISTKYQDKSKNRRVEVYVNYK